MTKVFRNAAGRTRASRRNSRLLLCSTAAILFLPVAASANPQGSQVVDGGASISSSGSTLTVHQSSERAIVTWQSFNIAVGETTNFIQPSSSAIILNRVTGSDPSVILGNLDANGQVWLINPNGIAFGKSARIDVAGLLATTIDIANSDFLSGSYHFSGLKSPGTMVTNAGQITIHDAGLAAFVAPGVENSGIIEANLGQIQLSSAAAFTIDFYGDGLFNFTLDQKVTQQLKKPDGTVPTAAATNSGQLVANGGHIFLTANVASNVVDNAINMSGVAQATSASVARNGDIELDGGSQGAVAVSGKLEASGTQAGDTGGSVTVTGQNVRLASTASVDVSGYSGGGTVSIGGSQHGVGPVRNASTTTIAAGAMINANAVTSGNGGQVVVWSDDQTNFQGTISSSGGSHGGNGGSAEVSSHQLLNFSGTADLRATNGAMGTLLLDPENVTIAQVGDNPSLSGASSSIEFDARTDNSVLSVSTLEHALSMADVMVTTGTARSPGTQTGDITVASSVNWSGPSTLTLSAYHDIVIDTGVTISNTGAGNLSLHSDNSGTGNGTVTFVPCLTAGCKAGLLDWSDSTGLVSILYNPTDNPAQSLVNPVSYTSPQDYTPLVVSNPAVANQLMGYMLVNTVYNLQNIENNLSGDYALGRDIDATGTLSWNGGAGFVPIGETSGGFFSGTIDGQGHTIKNLYINDSTLYFPGSIEAYVGLIAILDGTVRNLQLSNVSVTSVEGYGITGGIAGALYHEPAVGPLPSIENSSVSGNVSADFTGGFVGQNQGVIKWSYSNATVTGVVAGGFAAYNTGEGIIQDSYATGEVIAKATLGANEGVGGFVGSEDGALATIDGSYSTGRVISTGQNVVGGFLGIGSPGVNSSYWDIQSSGQASSWAGIGLSTAQFKAGLPSGFDPSIWQEVPSINDGYPSLRWQSAGALEKPLIVDFGIAGPTTLAEKTGVGQVQWQLTGFDKILSPKLTQIPFNSSETTPMTDHELEIRNRFGLNDAQNSPGVKQAVQYLAAAIAAESGGNKVAIAEEIAADLVSLTAAFKNVQKGNLLVGGLQVINAGASFFEDGIYGILAKKYPFLPKIPLSDITNLAGAWAGAYIYGFVFER